MAATPSSENFADLNQNSATLLGGKVDIVESNENAVLSNGVHVEDKNENRPRLCELDKQTPDSIADMTASSSRDTGFGSASVSEVSSPVENHAVVGRLQNQNAESETEGETYDSVVLGDETDNDENTLNDEASNENVLHTAHTKDANNGVEADNEDSEKTEKDNVHTSHTEAVNNEVGADNEDSKITEKDSVHTARIEAVNDEVEADNEVGADNEDSEKTEKDNVHTAHTEAINNEVGADNEDSKITEKDSVHTARIEAVNDEVEADNEVGADNEDSEKTEKDSVHTAHTEAVNDEVEADNEVGADNEDNEKTEKDSVHTAHTEAVNNEVEADNEDNEKTEKDSVHTAHIEAVSNEVESNNDNEKTVNENVVHTAHTEAVNNDAKAENEKTEKPVDSETQNTSVGNQISGNGEEGIVEKAKVEHINHASDIAENPEDIIEDHITKTEQKLVDSGNVGSTEHKEPDNENDDPASDKVIDNNLDETTNTNLEEGQHNEVKDFDVSEHVEYSEGQYKNTDDAVEVVNESGEGPVDKVVEEGDHNKLKEPETEQPASNDGENESIEKVSNDTANENIEQATNDITHSIEVEKEAGYEAKTEDAANEREQHTLEDVLADIEKAAIGEDQTVGDVVTGAAEDEKAGNKEEDGTVDILGNGLLKKKILVAGKGVHTRPNNGDIVTVRVDGQLPDGTHVDTEEITFNLNEGDVLLAFDLAVALMEEGEKCELYTSERYAYGSLGREPDIPKGTSITYTLELVKIEQPPAVTEMNYDQRLKIGDAKRERGNYLFGRTDYSGAINSYNRAVKLLDNPELNEGIDESCRSVITESWVKCYNNLAACQLKIDAVDSAIKSCEKVLSVQKDNVKALFRLAKAYGVKGEIDEAIGHLRHAMKLDPESKLMQQEMLNLTRRKSKETATEKELYKRMLGVRSGDKSLEDENKKGNSNKLVKWTLVAGGIAAVLISVGLTWYRAS